MPDKTEKRKHPRYEVRWPVTVFIGDDKFTGETINISIDGFSICCETPLHIDQDYRILIQPPDHPIINITGKAIWSNLYGVDDKNTTVGMGICFVEISKNNRDFFNDIISTYLKQTT